MSKNNPTAIKRSARSTVFSLLQKTFPKQLVQKYTHRKVIESFASSLGFVYFGFVDQHSDEHKLVRGFTMSVGHKDNHYCVGSLYGYDSILVERSDILRAPEFKEQRYNWIILQVDLHTSGAPHVFLSSLAHPKVFYSHFFIKYSRFQPLHSRVWVGHSEQFREKFKTYAAPEAAEQIIRILQPDTTAAIGNYFDKFEIEIQNDKLFLYLSNQVISQQALEVLLKNGLWLAGQIDAAQKR